MEKIISCKCGRKIRIIIEDEDEKEPDYVKQF